MKVLLPLKQIPRVISETTAQVLIPHGYAIMKVSENRSLTGEENEALLNELGNNVAQALVSLDLQPCCECPGRDVEVHDHDCEAGLYKS